MSQGNCCKCPERKVPIETRRWIVMQRCCNHSAFSGYRYTPSDYSDVQCHKCGATWRTKAGYVAQLKDGPNVYSLPQDQHPKGFVDAVSGEWREYQ